jgi:GTPase SAR1 family protein
MPTSSITPSPSIGTSITSHNHNKKIQCVVLGAADAGKTSLLRRYFRQTFDSGRVPTVSEVELANYSIVVSNHAMSCIDSH